METKTVLVTGIGGNVAQGILRNIRHLPFSIRLIGTNIDGFSAGNHLCDFTYQVPFFDDEKYIPKMLAITEKENVDLVIPSTDYEVYHLAKNRCRFRAAILASDSQTAKIYLDKYETYKYLSQHQIPFARSWLPGDYDFTQKEIIAKPREGRGSRGILINPEHPGSLPEGYMIQPYYRGKEITTAAYVDKQGALHGIFTFERSLTHGSTTQARVTFEFDTTIRKIAKQMIDLGGLAGSFNIQSMVTADGNIIPFEVNCRISGTNSIRHNLGFQDTKYALQEYLFNECPDRPKPVHGIAARILMDVIYPEHNSFQELNNKDAGPLLY